MGIFKKKTIRNKYLMPLLQVVVIAMLFVFVFDKECVFIFKNILEKLQVCEGYQTIIYNFLIPIKMFCHSPSVIAFLLVTVQVICFTTTFKFITQIFQQLQFVTTEIIQKEEYKTEKYIDNKNYVYLENQRLLC